MKGKTVAGKVGSVLSGLRFNYMKEDDSELGAVDFGVLTVAMMIAALDGVIQPKELAEFAALAQKCRVSAGERTARYDTALHSAGYIMLVSRSGASQKAIVETFVREAERVLPLGFAGGKAEDIRRALVIWISMGMSDGDFCGIERECVEAFRRKAAEIMRQRRDCAESLWHGLCPGLLRATRRKKGNPADDAILASDFMAKAEEVVRTGDSAAIRKFIVNG